MQKQSGTYLYEEIADKVKALIHQGVLKQGDKIPSIREMSSQLGVSLNSVKEAYWKLENQLYIESVPQSGFYVKQNAILPEKKNRNEKLHFLNPQKVSLCSIYATFREIGACPPEAQLGVAVTSSDLWPGDKLYKYFQDILRQENNAALEYSMSPGDRLLREQIVVNSIKSGISVSADEIVITSGCSESLYLAIQALCNAGDTVAIESPVYFNLLHLCELLGVKVCEIPNKGEGLDLNVFEKVVRENDLKAVICIPSFSNPTGSCMSDENKLKLVGLAEKYDIPLIEDAIYAELGFSGNVPLSCKSFDTTGNVLYCSSFSKILAPGLRVGWIIPGKHYERVQSYKGLMNLGAATLPQMAVARFLQEGGMERYLKKLRIRLGNQVKEMREYLLNNFPDGTLISKPEGGFVLWLELPEEFDTFRLYHELLNRGIIIAPGSMFSMSGEFTNCLRLNAGIWNEEVKRYIDIINETVRLFYSL